MTGHWAVRWWAAALLLLPLAAFASASSPSHSLVTVQSGALPPLANSAAERLLVLDGRLVALSADAAWLLDESRNTWSQAEWSVQGRVLADASDGQQGYLLMDSGGGKPSVGKLSLAADKLSSQPLPSLPAPLKSARLAVDGTTLLVAGVDSNDTLQLYALDLVAVPPEWRVRASAPSHIGAVTSLAAHAFAVFITAQGAPGAGDRMLRWKGGEGWKELDALPGTVVDGAAYRIGQAHILYLLRAADATKTTLASFHTITSSYATLAQPEGAARSGTGWKNGLAWLSFADGGSTQLGFAQIGSGKRGLTWLDWTIVIVYLAAMVGVGVYWYLRDRQLGSATEFFVGSRTIPFWAAGVSLYATNTSSISYLAIPAKAFETDWQYMNSKLITILGLMFVAVWIVPLLRRLDLVSVFNYLEMRFHPTIRMLASALCMLTQVGGRMSVVLFLPALAIATITGIDVIWSILLMGVCTIVYTAMGGMRAVVWTDFVQVIVLMGGAVFAIGFVFYSLGGTAVYDTAMAYDKTKLLNFSFDLTSPTIWGFLFLILFDTVLSFPKDQVLMQRTLSTRSDREAGRSIWMFAAIMLPGGLIFYGIGTVLFAYYKAHPERLDPLLPIDATFPLFIAAELPAGLTGLIIAGIFAAAMGTLSGTINSVATLLSVDFYEKLARNPTQKSSLRFAEWMSVLIGLVAIGLALLLSRYDIHSLLDLTIELVGVLGGGFAGAYTLGMFTRRANSAGVSIGVATAIVVTVVAWWYDLVHPYFYLGISIFVCIVVGYLASLLFPAPTRSLAGLTVFKEK